MKVSVVLFIVSLWSAIGFAQEIPHCSSYTDALGQCGRFLYLDQQLSLAPGQSYQCKLDFSVCTNSYINNWSLGVAEVRKSGLAEARDISLSLIDAASGAPVDLDAFGIFYFNDSSLYVRRVLTPEVWLVHVERAPAKRMTLKNYKLGSAGAISGR